MIAKSNRQRRDRIFLWSPKNMTENTGHFLMYDENQIFQDTLGQLNGNFNSPVSIAKNISGNHDASTKVFNQLF